MQKKAERAAQRATEQAPAVAGDRRRRIIMGPPVMLMGLTLLALACGFGGIRLGRETNPTPLILPASAGLAFVCAGLAVFLQGLGLPSTAFIYKPVGLVGLLAFFTPFFWVAFGASSAPLPVRLIFGLTMTAVSIYIILVTVMPANHPWSKRLAALIEKAKKNRR